MKRYHVVSLICILLLAFIVRIYGINWDQGFHLHPDERAIVMFTLPLHFPSTLSDIFLPSSPLNPHFFAYGSFPLYVLKIVGFLLSFINPLFSQYDGITLAGRGVSAVADTITVFFIFLIGKKIFGEKVGLGASFIYSLAVLPIQTSHFYAVDILLTTSITACLYTLLLFYENPTIGKSLLIGILFGIALSTKTSAIALIVSIGFTLLADSFFIFLKFQNHWKHRLRVAMQYLGTSALFGGFIFLLAGIVFFIAEPYALLDFSEFYLQNLQQYAMTKSAFTFPYTLQYVGKIPYIYELKNIFLWGLGPVIALFCFVGLLLGVISILQKRNKQKWPEEVILLVFACTYFAIVGKFAIGFMRYMLPLYPILTLFGGLSLYKSMNFVGKITDKNILQKILAVGIRIAIVIGIGYWSVSFLSIYTFPNTRVSASKWIQEHVPLGSTLAIEHWDDGLPLFGQEQYHTLTLPLYNPDTVEKWQAIDTSLAKTDYIIIASNRLYVPLQKLTNCKILPQSYCYTQTASYYKKLFSGQLGFTKVAEFSHAPTLPFLGIPINDQNADESFTVYDHPKVMIFKKISSNLSL